MGSICKVWEPNYWKFIFEGKSKIVTNDIIYKMTIGECDDYPYLYDINIFISNENYYNIKNGTYKIKKQSYKEPPIILYNSKQQEIPLVKGLKKNSKY